MTPISKSILRKTLLHYRRLIDPGIYTERNEALCNNLMELIQKEGFKTIHTFLPIERNCEPDVTGLFPELRKSGCKLVVSKTDFDNQLLEHFYLREDTILEKNRLGIPEPVDAEPADMEKVDLILVPLAAADRQGNRIGYGGGYYDRLLKESTATKVGLCLSPLLDELVQVESWDIPLDKILTPKNAMH